MNPGIDAPRIKLLLAMEPLAGGTLRHLQMILEALPRTDFDVHLAVSRSRNEQAPALYTAWRDGGCTVYDLPMVRGLKPWSDVLALLRLRSLCRRESFDVVHTHSAKAGFLGRMAARGTNATVVHTPHVFPFDRKSRDRSYLPLERLAARWTDRFLVLSRYQALQVARYGLARPENVTMLPNAVCTGSFGQAGRREARGVLGLAPDPLLVVGVGRLAEQKGFDVLVDAARMVAGRTPSVQFAILGSGERGSGLRRQVDEAGLAGQVMLPGHVQDVATWYAAADLVALPSRWEGLPYVLLEAKAAARPAVVSLVSGMEEFVTHGRDGFLVAPQDPAALADLIAGLPDRRTELQAMGRRARQGMRPEWTQEHFSSSIREIYRRSAGL
jgi:glycosyltransferase involved in cell wall biosynthesis